MEKGDDFLFFLFCWAFVAIIQIVVLALLHEATGEIRALRKLMKHDLKKHQEWLFKQLYTMAPGKVLRPDEEAPYTKESEKAVVINPNRDPMSEFNGLRDDFHG
jgi:hypothetical protein